MVFRPFKIGIHALVKRPQPGDLFLHGINQRLGLRDLIVQPCKFCAMLVRKDGKSGAEILKTLEESGLFDRSFRAVGIFDEGVDISNYSKVLWKIFNNVDPSRDIRKSPGGVCFIDACKKGILDGHHREWPDDLSFDK